MSDPHRQFAVEVVQRLVDAGHEALWAGGCVRDLLLGRDPGDYDVATSATPTEVRAVFGRRNTIPVGESFGVMLVRAPGVAWNVEVATFRSDLDYEDGRRPTGVVFTTPEEDAKRRDFTINGMFYDPLGTRVIDHVGGEADLARGLVRAIGDPRDRIREDKLRMLRAVRFTARFEFEIDPETADAVRELSGEIDVVSAERIAAELRKMLVDAHRRRAVELSRDLGLLHEVLPELDDSFGDAERTEKRLRTLRLLDAPSFELAFAALLLDVARRDAGRSVVAAIGRRLKLSNDEIDLIVWLVTQRDDVDRARALPLHQLKPLLAHDAATELLALARCDTIAAEGNLAAVLFAEEYLRETPPEFLDPPPLVTGRDLIDRGLKPGPRFKQILDELRRDQLDDRLQTRDAALTALDARLAQ